MMTAASKQLNLCERKHPTQFHRPEIVLGAKVHIRAAKKKNGKKMLAMSV
jgi:hypothetical protein